MKDIIHTCICKYDICNFNKDMKEKSFRPKCKFRCFIKAKLYGRMNILFINLLPLLKNTLVINLFFVFIGYSQQLFRTFKTWQKQAEIQHSEWYHTIEVIGFTWVIFWPVCSIGNVVKIPTGRQQGFITKGSNLAHFCLITSLPHFNNCVWFYLLKFINSL